MTHTQQQREILHQLFRARVVAPWMFSYALEALELHGNKGWLARTIWELGGMAGDWHTVVADHRFGQTTWGTERA